MAQEKLALAHIRQATTCSAVVKLWGANEGVDDGWLCWLVALLGTGMARTVLPVGSLVLAPRYARWLRVLELLGRVYRQRAWQWKINIV